MILPVEVSETHGARYIRWSGEAAEDQHHRTFSSEIRQANRILTIDIMQLKVRGCVPRLRGLGVKFLLPGPVFLSVFDYIKHGFAYILIINCRNLKRRKVQGRKLEVRPAVSVPAC